MASMSTVLPLCLSIFLFFQVSIAQYSFSESPLQIRRGFRGDQESRQQCRFDHLAALGATHQQRSEAGFTEYYNTEATNEFRCAGVSVRRLVVERKGLVLPMYANSHKLVYIVQGRGVFGVALPGCPETFQTVQSSFEQQMATASEAQSTTKKLVDEHQQIRQFHQGDVIAVPAGVAHWLYNNGDSPVVAFTVIGTNNNANQLNPRRREFFLAGKPRSWQQQLYSYKGEQQSSNQNIFAGFSPDLLSEALGVSKQMALRLQSLNDRRGAIIRVEHGLQALQPSFQAEAMQEGLSQQQQPTWLQSGRAGGQRNGLDDIMCSFKLRKNINNPQSSDIFNPRSGRITRANSQNFPILNIIQMSATRTVLQNNALLTPHWTVNAHTVMYVTTGQGHVQVVDNRGRSVFDGELRQQQILLIPQNFAVAVKARHEGFTWVSFKTNHNAIDSQIAGKASILRALPVDVVANSYRLSRQESRSVKFNRGDEMGVFAPRSGQQQSVEWQINEQ
ncbi:glutelin type-A 1-like [Oryza brachyantha]|uniref:Cupin type-1 domain-containing protein n=1 Tax=Oryza brachyantha TaxID=4533 RepID=J3LCI5_ORYBR|nr:glutelin type-A 1-like [Oryza brachyantha]